MRSTNNNLLQLVYRLITSGIILFIISEIVLAYVVAFHLIPSGKQMKLSKEARPIRIGLEKNSKFFLFDNIKYPNSLSISRLSHSYDSLVAFKNNLLDAVLTDQLTAQMLEEKYEALPYAFVFDESYRKPDRERLILVTKSKKADFFEQTKDFTIVFSSHNLSTPNIIIKQFLNDRTKDLTKWFKAVVQTDNEFEALRKVKDEEVGVAAVSEVLYKEYLMKNASSADDLRVLWYSSPIARDVIVIRKGLQKNQLSQLKAILTQEENSAFSWAFFDESLEELKKWKFTIRGKSFKQDESKFLSEKSL